MRDLDMLQSISDNITGKTLCAFGDAAATPVLTTLKHFRHEYEAHIKEGRCTLPADWRARQPVGASGDPEGSPYAWPNDHAAHRPDRPDALHLRRAAHLGGGDGVGGAPRRRAVAAAAGPIRVGWQGLLQPFADVIKLMFKEELRPRRGRSAALRARANHRGHRRVRGVRGRALRRRDDALRPARRADEAAGGGRQRRRPRDLRDRVDERLRHRARRLELEQQVLAARRAPILGADDQLRAVLRPGARRRAARRQLAVADDDGRCAVGDVVRLHPALVRAWCSRSAS